MSDFRTISLLLMFSKIFEKFIAQKLDEVTLIYDKLLQNLEDKKVICSIFLDLQKPFDSVDHSIILKN